MIECDVVKTVHMTVEPGSRVILTSFQAEIAKEYLKILTPMNRDPTDIKNKRLNSLTKAELFAIAADVGVSVDETMTKNELIGLIEKLKDG